MSLNILQIYSDGLSLLGFQNPDLAPPDARAHVLNDITAALQLMQLAGEDFYARENLQMNLGPGLSQYTFPEQVQSVLEPARLSTGVILMQLGTRAEFDRFPALFMGQLTPPPNGLPLAYFVETLRDDSGPDATQILLHVVPAPSCQLVLNLNVINDPPVYTAADLCTNPPAVPPVPHAYHESVLLPLVRYNVTRSYLYKRNMDRFPLIEADYLRALTLLGLADPVPTDPDRISKELKSQASTRTQLQAQA